MNQPKLSTIVQNLFEIYQLEKIDVSYTIQDYQIDYVRDHLNLLPTDEVLNHYSAEDRLNGLTADEILDKASPDVITKLKQKIVQH